MQATRHVAHTKFGGICGTHIGLDLSSHIGLEVGDEATQGLVVHTELLAALGEQACGDASCLVDVADGVRDLLGHKTLVQLCVWLRGFEGFGRRVGEERVGRRGGQAGRDASGGSKVRAVSLQSS
jgi:hypothetical protein